MPDRLEDMARELEATGDYRILRRLVPQDHFADRDGQDAFVGVVVDVETTGLDVTSVEVIELGMVKFAYSPEGEVFRVVDTFNQLQEPSGAIPEEVVRITGITDEMVAGRQIAAAQVDAFLSDAVLAIAHNARFDRRFASAFGPASSASTGPVRSPRFPGAHRGSRGAGLGIC